VAADCNLSIDSGSRDQAGVADAGVAEARFVVAYSNDRQNYAADFDEIDSEKCYN